MLNLFASICLLTLISVCVESNCRRVLVRKSSSSMTRHEWRSLQKAFQVIKSRPKTDVTSYYYQNAVHGWPLDIPKFNQTMADERGWTRAQHYNWWFLPWHRMYLYYFERILRSAANDPELTLPYWDYYAEHNRKVPKAYRIPADESLNSLYYGQRCQYANDGNENFPFDSVDHVLSLTQLKFVTDPNSIQGIPYPIGGYGSSRVESPVFSGPNGGAAEYRPHANMHYEWGGPKTTLYNSAADPLFFLHHSNIDRLWSTWSSQANRYNPDDQLWLNQEFSFFDERGNKVQISAKEVLNTERQLGYRYESLAELPTRRQQLTSDVRIGSLAKSSYTSNPLFVKLFDYQSIRQSNDAEIRVLLSGIFNFDVAFVTLYLTRPQSEPIARVASFITRGPHTNSKNETVYFRFPPKLSKQLLRRNDWFRGENVSFIIEPKMCGETIGKEKPDNYRFNVTTLDLFVH